MMSMTVSGIFQNVNRLTLPVIGVVWYAASRSGSDGGVEGWLVVLAVIALVILVAGIVFGVMVIRSEPLARKVGEFLSGIVGWASRKLKRGAPTDLTERLLGWRDDARDLIVDRWWQLWLTHFSTTVLVSALSASTTGDVDINVIVAAVVLWRLFYGLLAFFPGILTFTRFAKANRDLLADAGAAFGGEGADSADGAATSIPETGASGDTVPVGDDRPRQTHDEGPDV